MDPLLYHWNHDLLYEVVDVDAIRIADGFELAVHYGIKFESNILALKTHNSGFQNKKTADQSQDANTESALLGDCDSGLINPGSRAGLAERGIHLGGSFFTKSATDKVVSQRHQRDTQWIPWLLGCSVDEIADGCLRAAHQFGDLWLRQFAVTLNVGNDVFPVHAATITTFR